MEPPPYSGVGLNRGIERRDDTKRHSGCGTMGLVTFRNFRFRVPTSVEGWVETQESQRGPWAPEESGGPMVRWSTESLNLNIHCIRFRIRDFASLSGFTVLLNSTYPKGSRGSTVKFSLL